MKKTKKAAGRAGDSLDEALGMMQWSLAQRMEFEFQNYLWHRLLQVIPAPLHGSVMADHFRVQPEKRFQEWRIFARSGEVAHRLHFLAPALENQLRRLRADPRDLSLPLSVRHRLRQLAQQRISLRAVVRPELWPRQEKKYVLPPALARALNPQRPSEAEADRILDDFFRDFGPPPGPAGR